MNDQTQERAVEAAELEEHIGPEEHGPPLSEESVEALRKISSAVWGGWPASVTSEHGRASRCDWYQYGKDFCLNGCQHPGMDIGMPRGTKLYAAEAGVVTFAGDAPVFRPMYVSIRADSGAVHLYGHMWTIHPAVSDGQRVKAGQYLGDSGEQTKKGPGKIPDGSGPHLHFEVRPGGCMSTPEPVLLAAPIGGAMQRFRINDRIQVVSGALNFRAGAGVHSAVLEKLPTGTVVVVQTGPQASDGYDWYQARKEDGAGQGWLAGSFCARLPFRVDDRLRVAEGPLRLRSRAGLQSEVLASLPAETMVVVRDGPEAVDGHDWYDVRLETDSKKGWVAGGFCQRTG
jgi:murein DD-endopeptidase MepM/ murein hydrolase activator NlpD